MPVRFLRNAWELADVSWESPLPVAVANARFVPADTLLIATTNLFPTGERDLLGLTNPDLPTLDGCGQYRKLLWIYFREGAQARPATRFKRGRPTTTAHHSPQAG
jgi:hypothetical protein